MASLSYLVSLQDFLEIEVPEYLGPVEIVLLETFTRGAKQFLHFHDGTRALSKLRELRRNRRR